MPEAFAPRARAGLSAAPGSNTPRTRRSGRTASASAGALPRVRWDRVGRLAMLCVLAALLYLYLSAGIHMYSSWGQARRDGASVRAMEREHEKLLRQHEALARQGTVEGEARRLGMKKTAELQYVVSGLPAN
jgi:hypothetical protein